MKFVLLVSLILFTPGLIGFSHAGGNIADDYVSEEDAKLNAIEDHLVKIQAEVNQLVSFQGMTSTEIKEAEENYNELKRESDETNRQDTIDRQKSERAGYLKSLINNRAVSTFSITTTK